MSQESTKDLRFDKRLANRSGWTSATDLEKELSELPDVSDKIARADDPPEPKRVLVRTPPPAPVFESPSQLAVGLAPLAEPAASGVVSAFDAILPPAPAAPPRPAVDPFQDVAPAAASDPDATPAPPPRPSFDAPKAAPAAEPDVAATEPDDGASDA